ncbi:uncharacterized protein LOC134836589 [Culicoides brevitarsis]|uniref:uncharacterized protein LOC134836589 n=1 Tax=Culicoides brevitarsis TaxID=469753 RepID=UPI00307B7550
MSLVLLAIVSSECLAQEEESPPDLTEKFENKTENCASKLLAHNKVSRKEIAQWATGNFPENGGEHKALAEDFMQCIYESFDWVKVIKGGLKIFDPLGFSKIFDTLDMNLVINCFKKHKTNFLEVHKCIIVQPENMKAMLKVLTGVATPMGAFKSVFSKLTSNWGEVKSNALDIRSKLKNVLKFK